MASNVLVIPGGAGGLVRFNGGDMPLTLLAFSAAGATDLLLTVGSTAGGGPADNPQLIGDAGEVNAIVKSSAVIAAGDLVCKVNESGLIQLIKSNGTEPLLCTPIQKQNL
jgi:hypothetical protein